MEKCLARRKCSRGISSNCGEVNFLSATSPDTLCLTHAQEQNDRVTAAGGRPGAQHATAGGRTWPPTPGPEAAQQTRPGSRVEATNVSRPTRAPAPRCGAGQAGKGGGEGSAGHRQGRGPDVRRRSDAACVRDSDYVTEPRTLMPAAPPRPSPGPRHRRPRSARGPSAGREWRASGRGLARTPTQPWGSRGLPGPTLLPVLGSRFPLRAAAAAAIPPPPGRCGPE